MKDFNTIISTWTFSKIGITSSGAIPSRLCLLEQFWNLIELFGFGMTWALLSLNNKVSLRESGVKIVGTDFDGSCEGKSNSSTPVSTSSVLM